MTYKVRCIHCHKLFTDTPPHRRPRKRGVCDSCMQIYHPLAWKKLQLKRFFATYYPTHPTT
ncbi:hypothetical protein ES708_14029 [subsurface metagenome]